MFTVLEQENHHQPANCILELHSSKNSGSPIKTIRMGVQSISTLYTATVDYIRAKQEHFSFS